MTGLRLESEQLETMSGSTVIESLQINMLAEWIQTSPGPLMTYKRKPTPVSRPVACIAAKRNHVSGVDQGPSPRGCSER